MKKASLLMTC